ncbi:hypothetical protein ABIE12_002668 [Serratia sp. 509]
MTLKSKLSKQDGSRLECHTQKTGREGPVEGGDRAKGLFARAALAAFRFGLAQLQLGLQIAQRGT